MIFVLVVYNIQIEGKVSQIFFYLGPSFYFIIKNGEHFVIDFLTFILYFKK